MDGWVKIGTELDTKSFDAQIDHIKSQMDDIENKLKQSDMGFEVGDTVKLEAQYEKLNNQLGGLVKKKQELDRQGLTNLEQSIKNVGRQTDGVIRKIGRWAFAIVGVRSAYMGIRRVISMVRGENEEIDASFKSIGNFFATALEPLVKRLVNWMMILVQYINYLAKAWFGVDILAKSNEKALKGANKQAKELSKTLTGFDEMNVINDSGGTGVASSSVGALPIPTDAKIPSWLEWIANNRDTILGVVSGIAGGLLGIKFGLEGIEALGLGLMIFGVIELIGDLNEYIGLLDGSLENNGTTWQDFGKILTDIGIIVLGLGFLTGNLPLIIAGVLTTIVGLVLQNWGKIKATLDGAWKWLDEKLKWIETKFGLLGQLITDPIRIAINTMKNLFEGLFKTVKRIFDGILLIFKGDFKNGFISIAKGIANAFITVINTMINGLNMAISPFRALIVAFGKVTGKGWTMDNIKIPTIKYMKTGGIINLPNRGVPIGNNVRGGESGAEGVLPLTDNQTMDTLGAKIAQHIPMTIIVENKMDGKVIGREVKRIQGQQDFLMNR